MITQIKFREYSVDLSEPSSRAFKQMRADIIEFDEIKEQSGICGSIIYAIFDFNAPFPILEDAMADSHQDFWGEDIFLTWVIRHSKQIEETFSTVLGSTIFLQELVIHKKYIDSDNFNSFVDVLVETHRVNHLFTCPELLHEGPMMNMRAFLKKNYWSIIGKQYMYRIL
jgi:hypothetical protein